MDSTKFYGIYGEGRNLCPSCAERIYGTSLASYFSAGEIQAFTEKDRSEYAKKGLLCDECSSWIIEPARTDDAWWLFEPEPEEHLRLLAPFVDFLETLQVDAMNLKIIVA